MDKHHIASTKLQNKSKRDYKRLPKDVSLMRERFLSLALVEQAPVGCWLPDTTLTFVNQAYCDFLGKNEKDLLGKKWISFMPCDIREKAEGIYARLIKEPTLHRFEYSIMRKRGLCVVEWVDHPVCDQYGNVVEFLSVGRDITQYKKNEQDLIESEKRTARIVSSMQEGLISHDASGVITYVNDSFLHIFKNAKINLIGKSVYDLVDMHEGINALLINQVQRQNNAQPMTQELFVEYDPQITHVHVSIVPIFDQYNNYRGGFAIVADISQQKKTEERLKKINDCLLNLHADASRNIQYLTQLFGEVMGATCALYNYLDREMLYTYGRWHAPKNLEAVDKADGHICYDVIKHSCGQPYIVRDLQHTSYYRTDPNVARYGLHTYIGQAVKSGSAFVGSLCAVFQHDYEPTQDDVKVMGIIVSAISSEVEKSASQMMLKNKMNMQHVIAAISSRFVGDFDFDSAVNDSLADMGALSGASRAYVFLLEDEKHMSNTHDWCAPGVDSKAQQLQRLPIDAFPWWMKQLQKSKTINIKDVSQMYIYAKAEHALIAQLGITSLLAFPIFANGRVEGFLGFDNIEPKREWHDDDLMLLHVCAEMIGKAVEVKKALAKVRATKREWEITVDALPQIICLLDRFGKIVRVNKPVEEWGVSNLRDAQGKSIHEIFHPMCKKRKCDLARDINATWGRVCEGVSGESVHVIEWLQKTICIKMHPHTSIQENDDSYTAIAVVYDITEKIKANQKIFDMFKYLGLINRKVSILLNMRKSHQKKDAENVYMHIVQSSLQIAEARFSLLYHFDAKERHFHLLSSGGVLSQTDKKRLKILKSDSHGFLRKLMRIKKRVQGSASDEDFRTFVSDNKFRKTIHTCLAMPIMHQNEVKGMMLLGFHKDHDLSTQELEFYDLFSLQACLIMMNAKEE